MRPREFTDEQMRLGWLALAAKTLDLCPGETDALGHLMRAPGRVVTMEALAEVTHCRNGKGSRWGALKRIERLRAKLTDVGCVDVVTRVSEAPNKPALGFVVSAAAAEEIRTAIRSAFGVDDERLAA